MLSVVLLRVVALYFSTHISWCSHSSHPPPTQFSLTTPFPLSPPPPPPPSCPLLRRLPHSRVNTPLCSRRLRVNLSPSVFSTFSFLNMAGLRARRTNLGHLTPWLEAWRNSYSRVYVRNWVQIVMFSLRLHVMLMKPSWGRCWYECL